MSHPGVRHGVGIATGGRTLGEAAVIASVLLQWPPGILTFGRMGVSPWHVLDKSDGEPSVSARCTYLR